VEKVPFYRADLDRKSTHYLAESVAQVIELIDDPTLVKEIQAGNVTLAMIRPKVGPEANNLGLSDEDASNRVEEMIEGLGVMAKFSFHFSREAAEEFYGGGPQESMSKEPPRNPQVYDSRWSEFVDFMMSGPTTALLLYSPDSDAIPRWRAHLGHWNIDEIRDLSTIRGKLGVNKYNNLVHGSDATEAVTRELGILRECLETGVNNEN